GGGRAATADQRRVLDGGARVLRARARWREAAGAHDHVEPGPPVVVRGSDAGSGEAHGGHAARGRDDLGLGDPHAGAAPADLQSAVVPQRHDLSARQLVDRARARALWAAPTGRAGPGLAVRRGAPLPVPAAAGAVLRDLAWGDGRAG